MRLRGVYHMAGRLPSGIISRTGTDILQSDSTLEGLKSSSISLRVIVVSLIDVVSFNPIGAIGYRMHKFTECITNQLGEAEQPNGKFLRIYDCGAEDRVLPAVIVGARQR